MSSQNSRYNGQQVVNSFNIFVDTEKSSVVGDRQSKGDDTKIHFEGNTISANDGEIIRLSLTNFTMFNNLYMIDRNNSAFNICMQNGNLTGGTKTISTDITHQNYNNVRDVALNVATNLGNALLAEASSLGSNTAIWSVISVLPLATAMNATGNRLLDITLESRLINNTTPVAHLISAFQIQSVDDNYIILGGNRLDSVGTLSNSLKTSIVGANRIRIQGYYTMNRMSDPYVYLRCGSAQNSLEMSVLSNDRGQFTSDVLNSDILGKVFRDVEFISFDSGTGNEYFINLQNKKLAQLSLFLTDSKGRRLGRKSDERNTETAAGLGTSTVFEGTQQSTQGNLYFTAVVRVDIIKVSQPQTLETSQLPKLPNASKTQQGIITWPDYGKPKY